MIIIHAQSEIQDRMEGDWEVEVRHLTEMENKPTETLHAVHISVECRTSIFQRQINRSKDR